MTGAILSLTQRSRTAQRSVVLICSAAALTCCKAAWILAKSVLRKPTFPCNGVRRSVVWPERFVARPTVAGSSGLLVMASMHALLDLTTTSPLTQDHRITPANFSSRVAADNSPMRDDTHSPRALKNSVVG